MSLATVGETGPCCTPVFYSALRNGQWLAFYSKPNSLHISNLKINPMAAASIYRETRKPGFIQGLQLTGTVSAVSDSNRTEVKKSYLAAHPLAATVLATRNDACLYIFEVHKVVLTDTVSLGFGRKIIWDFSDGRNEAMAINAEHCDTWELDYLADHIVNTHHQFIKTKLPEISEYARKVASVHGERHPETIEIARHVAAIASELSMHMQKEELILFPYLKSLVMAKKEERTMRTPPFGSAKNPIRMMEQEHRMVGDEFADIRKLSNNYQPPEGACTTYRVLFSNLKAFDEDLQLHVHLENNILFPRSLKLEEEVLHASER